MCWAWFLRQVCQDVLEVSAANVYQTIHVALPYPVEEETVVAKFDKKRRELELLFKAAGKPSPGLVAAS